MSRGIVHVVDDDTKCRVAMGRMLRSTGFDTRLYAGAREYLAAADDSEGPACILLDLRMPGATGLDLQRILRERGNAHPVIFISGHADIPTTVRAIREGAIDFLTKPVEMETLLSRVELALAEDGARSARRAYLAAIRERYGSLTPRERQVMAGVVAGLLNKQICFELDSAVRTVKTHRSRVMAKMHVRSVPDLVRLAGALREAGVEVEVLPQR